MRARLSTKIIFMVGLVLILGMGFSSVYIIMSEKDLLLGKAYSQADSTNSRMFVLMTAVMQLGLIDHQLIHNVTNEVQFAEEEEDEILELRLICSPDIAKTYIDRGITEEYRPTEEEQPRDEIERRALQGEAFRGEAVVKINDKNYRAVRFITPFKAEKRCLPCHTVREGDTMGALSSIISLELIHQTIQERIAQVMLLMGIAFTLTVLVLYFALHKIVIAPLGTVSRITKMITRERDLSKKIRISNQDEIGDLAVSFNKMTDDLIASLEKEKEHAAAAGEVKKTTESV